MKRVRFNAFVHDTWKDGSKSTFGDYAKGFKSKGKLISIETVDGRHDITRCALIKVKDGSIDVIPIKEVKLITLFGEFINWFKNVKS